MENKEITNKIIPLSKLPLGRKTRVRELKTDGQIRRRLLDLGLINDTVVEALQRSPSGEPVAYAVRGAVIALRSDESSKIIVEALY